MTLLCKISGNLSLLRKRISDALDDDYEEDDEWYFAITDGRCPMWRQDGLCRIQAALGEQALCKTCREFPRLTHDYGDFVELGLEQALAYLHLETLSLPQAPMGHLLLTYEGTPLGFAKNVGNRANNLYPAEWRIRKNPVEL